MKNLIIAAALIVTTTVTIADAQAGRDRPYIPKTVVCIEPEQGHVVEPQPPAYIVTLERASGGLVEYLIDNQFAMDVGITNLARFYGTQFDAFVVRAIKDECEVDTSETCTFLNVDELSPGPRVDGVNSRPSGMKFD